MSTVIDYKVVTSCNKQKFEQEVLRLIQQDYVLQGGVSVTIDSDTDTFTYSQALILT